MGLYKRKPTLGELYTQSSGALFEHMQLPSGGPSTADVSAALLVELGELQTIFSDLQGALM